jgi:FAD/FMN-containing dehydrogenase
MVRAVGGRSFVNWNGSASSTPSVVVAPADVEELARVITDRDSYPSPVRPAGNFHSLVPCFETTGTQVLLDNFRDVRVDLAANTITVGASLPMIRMRDILRLYGMQTEVTPEIGTATVGSVACCGTKDSSVGKEGLAQISSTVVGMRLVNPNGEIETVTEESDPERMRVLRSSYGLLGIVFEVTLRIQPIVTLRYDYRAFPMQPAPSRDELLGDADGMLCLLQAFANRVIVERRYIAGGTDVPISRFSKLKRLSRDKLWELATSYFATKLPYNWFYPVLDQAAAVHLLGVARLGGFMARRADSTIEFSRHRQHYFDFSYFAIPARRFPAFLPEYVGLGHSFLGRTGFRPSAMALSYHMRRDEHALLSATPGEDVMTIDAVDHRPNHPLWAEFNRELNEIAADFGGRPILNQTKQLSGDVLHRTMGEEWKQFLAIRATQDPDDRMLSDFFRQLM